MSELQAPDDDGLAFGPMRADEIELVIDSISKPLRNTPWAGYTPNHLWHAVIKASISGLLERGAQVLCARSADKVLGYTLYEPKGADTVLHWVYVKDVYRRTGICRRLVSAASPPGQKIFYTYRTKSAPFVLKGRVAIWAPEIVRRKEL